MTHRTNDILAAAAVASLALGLAACSAGTSSTEGRASSTTSSSIPVATAPPTGNGVEVALGQAGCDPAEVSVKEGDAVRFSNHLATATRVHFLNLGSSGPASSPEIAPGASWSLIAPGPRSILYEAAGVEGRSCHIQVTFS